MRRWIVCTLLFLLACAKAEDPFDAAAIERDLKNRTPQDVFDAARKIDFTPGQRGITHKEIVDFVRTTRLSARIREVAEREYGKETDEATRAFTRAEKLNGFVAAIGMERSYATADLRAALSLGLNPREMEWVRKQIEATLPLIETTRTYDASIARAKSELDATVDPYVIPSKQAEYDAAVQSKATWEAAQTPVALANRGVVLQHRAELKEIYPSLERP